MNGQGTWDGYPDDEPSGNFIEDLSPKEFGCFMMCMVLLLFIVAGCLVLGVAVK